MSSHELLYNGETVSVEVTGEGDRLRVKVGQRVYELHRAGDNAYLTTVNGTRKQVAVVRHRGTYYVDIDSVLLEVKEPSEEAFGGAAGDHGGEKDKVFAPMPGKIVKIMVAVGDEVRQKQPLVIVEAMKMENQINARADGRVKAVNFAPGDQVDTESPIVELELAE